jgi:hypothetical protein
MRRKVVVGGFGSERCGWIGMVGWWAAASPLRPAHSSACTNSQPTIPFHTHSHICHCCAAQPTTQPAITTHQQQQQLGLGCVGEVDRPASAPPPRPDDAHGSKRGGKERTPFGGENCSESVLWSLAPCSAADEPVGEDWRTDEDGGGGQRKRQHRGHIRPKQPTAAAVRETKSLRTQLGVVDEH